jgi:hypothetical protein
MWLGCLRSDGEPPLNLGPVAKLYCEYAAIEEGHYFKVGINPELQLSKFKQQNINFSRLADIEKPWEEYIYGADYLHRYQQEAKKIVSREIERFLSSPSVNCILMLQCTLPHCAPTAYPASPSFPSLIHSNPVSSLIDSELKE